MGVIRSELRDVLGGGGGLGIYRITVDGCWKCRRFQVAGIVGGGWLGLVGLWNLRICSTGLNSAVTAAGTECPIKLSNFSPTYADDLQFVVLKGVDLQPTRLDRSNGDFLRQL